MMTIKKILLLACLVLPTSMNAQSVSKLHLDLDYHYNLGVSQSFAGRSYSRNAYKMGGNSLQIAARYDVAPQWSVGAGLGAARYTDLDFNTFPVFATLRYKPSAKIPQGYVFTNLGYAVKCGDDTYPGLAGKLGVGYTWMLARHFGLNFQLAYDIKEFRGIPTTHYNGSTGAIHHYKTNSMRHSLSFGVGLTF